MYIATGLILFLFILLGVLSAHETVDAKVSVLLLPFYRIASFLYKKACIYRLKIFSGRQVEKDLKKLYPGENEKQKSAEYYIGKLAKSLLICLAGTFLGLIISVQAKENQVLKSGIITRGAHGEDIKEIVIESTISDKKQEFNLEVASEVYDKEELEQLYDSFVTMVSDSILGANVSLQEVHQNLYLQQAYEGYPFEVSWESENPDILGSDGVVNQKEEGGGETILWATISYGEWKRLKEFQVRVVQLSLSQEERLYLEVSKLLTEAEQNSRTESVWQLPDNWRGEEITWRQKIEDKGLSFWVGGIIVSVLVYLMADKDLHDEVEKRKIRMKRDYPDIVHKLTLYLGAGITIRGAFGRIAEEYEQDKGNGKELKPIYEEVLHTCRELKSGVSEGTAYEHFGKQTGLQEYIRLSTLLSQNLKKGNNTLLQRLREEADKATEERILNSKKMGEEAMTKMLLPMVMMLLVVMLLIMIPAFSSVGN